MAVPALRATIGSKNICISIHRLRFEPQKRWKEEPVVAAWVSTLPLLTNRRPVEYPHNKALATLKTMNTMTSNFKKVSLAFVY